MTLQDFFGRYKSVAIALSGGVDSIYLMYAAKQYCADVRAYFAKTEFQPELELRDAEAAARECGVELCVIDFSVLEDENISKNGADRCYWCKRGIMQIIYATALSDGCEIICDGTNASDDAADRPGFRALAELNIMSPLRLCGITKSDVRRLALEAGLSVWDKPSYACLATRIKTGEEINREKLSHIDEAEKYLAGIGFSDFRVRKSGDSARLELRLCDMERLIEKREGILSELKKHFGSVSVDLEARDEKLCD